MTDKYKRQRDYYQRNKDIISQKEKEKYKLDSSKKLNYAKKYRLENLNKINKYKLIYNKDKIKESNKKYYIKNKNKIREQQYKIKKERLLNDQIFKLKNNIQSLLRLSFKSNNFIKKTKTVEILGCTIQEFKEHLESQFESWMNWDNYGNPKDGIFELNKTWDIDHIIPLKTAKTEEDIIRLNHYTNLQPLCSYYNRWVKRNLNQ